MSKETALEGKKTKKRLSWWKILIIVVLSIVLIVLAFVGIVTLVSHNRGDRTDSGAVIENKSGLVQQKGSSLYDKDGNRLILKGVNAGGMLVSEGWLVPYSVGEKLDADNNIIYDSNNIPTYPELPMEDVIEGLNSNPNITDSQRKEFIDTFRENWFSDSDFKVVKEQLGYNSIRLPFYYRDILDQNEDGSFKRKEKEDAFSYFDWFLSECQKYSLYCILDLHGAPGSQNGYEHSGYMKGADLWTNDTYINATADLWKYVSSYYTVDKPDLGKWIATYDILNEPCGDYNDKNKGTTDICYPVFDKIYDAIRDNNDNHVITIEGVWDFSNFPDPATYSWTNIQYEIHMYNWNNLPTWLFLDYYEVTSGGKFYDVPYYVGEFTCFDYQDKWNETMSYFDKKGYSFSLWNYKAVSTGFWTTTWSIYTEVMNLQNDKGTKTNLKTANYDELIDMALKTNSSNCTLSNTYKYVREYQGLK
ncbi:MAG: cellulase family glycosylhydrolase [Bacilli bacterium]